jgi:hypothetical protein
MCGGWRGRAPWPYRLRTWASASAGTCAHTHIYMGVSSSHSVAAIIVRNLTLFVALGKHCFTEMRLFNNEGRLDDDDDKALSGSLPPPPDLTCRNDKWWIFLI